MTSSEKALLYRHCSIELISISDCIITIYPGNLRGAVNNVDEAIER